MTTDHITQPQTSLALNLCDAGHSTLLATENPAEFSRRLDTLREQAAGRNATTTLTHIYVGSYFCDRFFLTLDAEFFDAMAHYAAQHGLELTLVAPLFSQSTWAEGKSHIANLLAQTTPTGAPLFDEAVANDPAMAVFLKETATQLGRELTLSYGRMMAKTSRDPRHSVMEQAPQPYALDAAQAIRLAQQFGYTMAECDPFAPAVDASALGDTLPLALHLPHSLQTTGHICPFASTYLPVEKKFRPGMPCAQECLSGIQVYESFNLDTEEPVYFTRLGRTVFFENPGCQITGVTPTRIIWTPADYLFGSIPAPAEPTDYLFGATPAPAEPADYLFGSAPAPAEPADYLFGATPAPADYPYAVEPWIPDPIGEPFLPAAEASESAGFSQDFPTAPWMANQAEGGASWE